MNINLSLVVFSRFNWQRVWPYACFVFSILNVACSSDDPSVRLAKLRSKLRERYSDVQQISTEELFAWLIDKDRTKPLLLDIRTVDEYRVSHLKNARRVEPGKPTTDLLALLQQEKIVVVYCSVGVRSMDFARELKKHGIKRVYNLDGAIFKWANEGRPLFSEKQQVKRVNPYNWNWGHYLNKELHSTTKKAE